MPFGMKNSPAMFHLINEIINGLNNRAAYIDDVIIYNNTWENICQPSKNSSIDSVMQI